jgi:hypothetical protein
VEAMAENYRVELSGFGVQSTLLELGGFTTNFGASLMTPSDDSQAESYGDFMNAPAASAKGGAETMKNFPKQTPDKVSAAILNLIETPSAEPPFRTIVDFIPW